MLLPTNELVAITWLRTLDGIPSDKVSTKLPETNEVEKISGGFVTVRTVGGEVHTHLPRRAPVLEVSCWATEPDGRRKPPVARANQLAEIIYEACYDESNFGLLVTKPGYDNAGVQSAYPLTVPRKMNPPDPARYALFTFDLQMHWVRIPGGT